MRLRHHADREPHLLGLEIEQGQEGIDIHLNTYIQEAIKEYKKHVKTALKPKKVPMQQGVMLDNHDCPEFPDPAEQTIFRSITAKLQFGSTWVRCNTSFTIAQLARFCASTGR